MHLAAEVRVLLCLTDLVERHSETEKAIRYATEAKKLAGEYNLRQPYAEACLILGDITSTSGFVEVARSCEHNHYLPCPFVQVEVATLLTMPF